MTAEELRLEESRKRKAHWQRWGPYISERAWGTVREDYSADGDAWEYFPFSQAHLKAFRWNEDGIAGICDRHQKICFAVALWNGRDPILKERLFGLSNPEGNHGEDVKECYYYLDNTPTHSWMKFLYKYPQAEFPYARLIEENGRRTREQPEFELADTGVFSENRYFDVIVEYAKATPEEIAIRITVVNRGPDAAELQLLPTIWFRNVWSWGRGDPKPLLKSAGANVIELDEIYYGKRRLIADGSPELLFCDNESDFERLNGNKNETPFPKSGIGEYVVHGDKDAVNPDKTGTKAAARYKLKLGPGESATIRLRFTQQATFGNDFERVFADRQREADEYYAAIIPARLTGDGRNVMRQALAGLLWSKQFYHYVVRDWLDGDPAYPPPPEQRKEGRNHQWENVYNSDVISMPDKWEYPWYAAWDLGFHAVALALVDSEFAKSQLLLMLREWYMHPNGHLPAYEWCFSDVNPPVYAWAAWRVYKMEQKRRAGVGDRVFLERIFHKLLLNFTWWVNRKDAEGRNVFQGGFLGLDNIGVFDRSKPLPNGASIEQADSTGWMGMYCLNMLAIAMELAREDPAYEDVASKFWEHFLYIAHAMNNIGPEDTEMWDEEDGFFYDIVHTDGKHTPVRLRSLVGLIPLCAVETLEPRLVERLQGFNKRMQWFIDNRPDLTGNVACMLTPGREGRRLLSIVDRDQLRKVLSRMLDQNEFLSPFGIRSLSRAYAGRPYVLRLDGTEYNVEYEPGLSKEAMFGGNSNWRGPVWFPVNFLLIESLQKLNHYYGDGFQVECPTGSGVMMTLWEVAAELSKRLSRLFLCDSDGRRPANGGDERYRTDPNWRDLVLFYEFFDAEKGMGLGASHQTGWTALVAKLLQQSGE